MRLGVRTDPEHVKMAGCIQSRLPVCYTGVLDACTIYMVLCRLVPRDLRHNMTDMKTERCNQIACHSDAECTECCIGIMIGTRDGVFPELNAKCGIQ
jgi:hypothetical protein